MRRSPENFNLATCYAESNARVRPKADDINLRSIGMRMKLYFVLLLSGASDVALGQGNDDLDRKMLNNCQVLAKELSASNRVHISTEEIKPLFTWHAACAERPPIGPGKVTALCEGKPVVGTEQERVFFWQKETNGKFNRGFSSAKGNSRIPLIDQVVVSNNSS